MTRATHSQHHTATAANAWKQAAIKDLDAILPDRAPVMNERVEIERSSETGVVDQHGRTIAAVVLITTGYSANGKYSEYLLTQVPLEISGEHLAPGRYLIGWTRSADGLAVTISESATGRTVATSTAKQDPALHRVEQIRIWPPTGEGGSIQLGRFSFRYQVR